MQKALYVVDMDISDLLVFMYIQQSELKKGTITSQLFKFFWIHFQNLYQFTVWSFFCICWALSCCKISNLSEPVRSFICLSNLCTKTSIGCQLVHVVCYIAILRFFVYHIHTVFYLNFLFCIYLIDQNNSCEFHDQLEKLKILFCPILKY